MVASGARIWVEGGGVEKELNVHCMPFCTVNCLDCFYTMYMCYLFFKANF